MKIKKQKEKNKKNKKKERITCRNCNSSNTIRKGIKKNKLQKLQKYYCKDCRKIFTISKTPQKTYPARIVMEAISTYNLGNSAEKTSRIINQRFKTATTDSTIHNWVSEHKALCPYHRIRKDCIHLHNPKDIIFRKPLQHQQVYLFQYHMAKLEMLFRNKLYNNRFTSHCKFHKPISTYLNKIPTQKFPHHIFKTREAGSRQRISQLKLNTLPIRKIKKKNYANKLADLALKIVKNNRERHGVIERFMLINDTTTLAVEIPVYLTNHDLKYFRKRNFILNLESGRTPITGHIDILQVRNNLIHVLDYKPEAHREKEKVVQQLTLYALALASRTKLALKDFKCAWFDDRNYYEFFPLHCVYERRVK